MPTCKYCGKPIPEGLTYCNQTCLTRAKKQEQQNRTQDRKEEQNNPESNIFWFKGEGMNRRNHNIETIARLIQQGLTYQQIWRKSRRFFTSRKFDEYYEIASDEIDSKET